MRYEAYILKAEKVAVMAILANKKWRNKCVNLDKTKIATKVKVEFYIHQRQLLDRQYLSHLPPVGRMYASY